MQVEKWRAFENVQYGWEKVKRRHAREDCKTNMDHRWTQIK